MSENDQKEADVAFLLDAAQKHIDPNVEEIDVDLANKILLARSSQQLRHLRNWVEHLLQLGFTRINLLRLNVADWISDPGAEQLLKMLAE